MNITAAVIAALDRTPGPAWDVLPGLYTAPPDVCGEYASAGAAHHALTRAGFEPTARFVAAPPLAPKYDLQTVMRYSAGDGRDVLLVRRGDDPAGRKQAAPVELPSKAFEQRDCLPHSVDLLRE